MNCLDCNNPTTHVPAVAVCHDCGAGICADHANIEPNYLTRMVPLGMPVAVEPPGRIIRCTTCANATPRRQKRRKPPTPQIALNANVSPRLTRPGDLRATTFPRAELDHLRSPRGTILALPRTIPIRRNRHRYPNHPYWYLPATRRPMDCTARADSGAPSLRDPRS